MTNEWTRKPMPGGVERRRRPKQKKNYAKWIRRGIRGIPEWQCQGLQGYQVEDTTFEDALKSWELQEGRREGTWVGRRGQRPDKKSDSGETHTSTKMARKKAVQSAALATKKAVAEKEGHRSEPPQPSCTSTAAAAAAAAQQQQQQQQQHLTHRGHDDVMMPTPKTPPGAFNKKRTQSRVNWNHLERTLSWALFQDDQAFSRYATKSISKLTRFDLGWEHRLCCSLATKGGSSACPYKAEQIGKIRRV